MDKNFLKLTDSVYKLLECFPESDPLKNRAKDKALAICENLQHCQNNPVDVAARAKISEDVEMLLGYLWIAKSRGWLAEMNYIIASSEYEKAKNSLAPVAEMQPASKKKEAVRKEKPVLIAKKAEKLSPRQEKIIGYLKKNKEAQVMDLLNVLGGVTKRTIRRDLDDLLNSGRIMRMGEFNQVSYKIN